MGIFNQTLYSIHSDRLSLFCKFLFNQSMKKQLLTDLFGQGLYSFK